MNAIHTNDRFRRPDKARGDREFFVAGVQPELTGEQGMVTLIYRDTGFLKRIRFDKLEAFLRTAVRIGGGWLK